MARLVLAPTTRTRSRSIRQVSRASAFSTSPARLGTNDACWPRWASGSDDSARPRVRGRARPRDPGRAQGRAARLEPRLPAPCGARELSAADTLGPARDDLRDGDRARIQRDLHGAGTSECGAGRNDPDRRHPPRRAADLLEQHRRRGRPADSTRAARAVVGASSRITSCSSAATSTRARAARPFADPLRVPRRRAHLRRGAAGAGVRRGAPAARRRDRLRRLHAEGVPGDRPGRRRARRQRKLRARDLRELARSGIRVPGEGRRSPRVRTTLRPAGSAPRRSRD